MSKQGWKSAAHSTAFHFRFLDLGRLSALLELRAVQGEQQLGLAHR